MLRHCAIEVICATLCGQKKVCCDHCDSNWVCCDFVRPKIFARLCVAQKKFVATIAIQNGYCATEVICATLCGPKKNCYDHCDKKNEYVVTLCDRSYLRDFVWPKKSLLRPLRLKMGMLRHCATEVICATLCGPKKSCCDHCDSKWVWYVATLCNRSYLRDFVWQKKSLLRPLRLKLGVLRLCATEDICATLCGPKKVCCDHCDSKWVLCDRSYLRDFVWPEKSLLRPLRQKNGYVATLCDQSYLRDFVWPKKNFLRPLRLKMGMLQHCAIEIICTTLCDPKKVCSNHCDSKWVCCDIVRLKLFARLCVAQKNFVATIATQNGYVATLCDRSYLRDFVWPKKSLLRPLRFKMDMLLPSQAKSAMLRPLELGVCCTIANQISYDANHGYVAILRDRSVFGRNCATQKRYVATIETKNGVFANLRDRRVFVPACVNHRG